MLYDIYIYIYIYIYATETSIKSSNKCRHTQTKTIRQKELETIFSLTEAVDTYTQPEIQTLSDIDKNTVNERNVQSDTQSDYSASMHTFIGT